MELTNEQLIELQSKLKIRECCPNCGSAKRLKLDRNQYLLTSMERLGNNFDIGAPVKYHPVFTGCCLDCGFMTLFNLRVLGIVLD